MSWPFVAPIPRPSSSRLSAAGLADLPSPLIAVRRLSLVDCRPPELSSSLSTLSIVCSSHRRRRSKTARKENVGDRLKIGAREVEQTNRAFETHRRLEKTARRDESHGATRSNRLKSTRDANLKSDARIGSDRNREMMIVTTIHETRLPAVAAVESTSSQVHRPHRGHHKHYRPPNLHKERAQASTPAASCCESRRLGCWSGARTQIAVAVWPSSIRQSPIIVLTRLVVVSLHDQHSTSADFR